MSTSEMSTGKKWGIGLAIFTLVGPFLIIGPIIGVIASLFASSAGACTTTAGAPASGDIRVPIGGKWNVSSEWGLRFHPVDKVYKHHGGIDFTGSKDVVAAQGGTVTATPTTGGGGNQITIDHGGGVETQYLHLASRDVTVGARVWAGQRIGTMGTTGKSTGVHLHFVVKINGQDTNPRDWLKLEGKSGTAAPVALNGDLAPTSVETIDVSQTTVGGPTKSLVSPLPSPIGAYQTGQVMNAAEIIKAGQALGLDARTVAIGIMTAMGESSLLNLLHGDAVGPDSRGLFQQRDNGAWGSYTDRTTPIIAATNFFKALLKVPGFQSLSPTEAAHQTQRNADPNHYAPYWSDAVTVLATLTGDPALTGILGAGTAAPVVNCGAELEAGATGSGTGQAVVDAAKAYLGTPYSWGGGTTAGPSRGTRTSSTLDGSGTVGFDCSGLVLYAVNASTGIALPHSAEAQGTDSRGRDVARDFSQMKPGDVISFSSSGRAGDWGHSGIYIGAGQMIHAPRTGKNVEIITIQGVGYWEAKVWRIKRYAA